MFSCRRENRGEKLTYFKFFRFYSYVSCSLKSPTGTAKVSSAKFFSHRNRILNASMACLTVFLQVIYEENVD